MLRDAHRNQFNPALEVAGSALGGRPRRKHFKYFRSRYRRPFPGILTAWPPVCTENLNPNVVVMKSAQDGVRTYDAGSLDRTRDRRILVQRPMRSNAVVIGRIVFQNAAQMFLAQDNDMVQTLAPDRSDQPFGKAILPR